MLVHGSWSMVHRKARSTGAPEHWSTIRICCLCVLLSWSLLLLPQAVHAASTNQISQFGITWTFDTEYEYGQFANGDYWVVGPVTIIGIDPVSTEYSGETEDSSLRIMHGSMVNPDPDLGATQGYDSYLYAYPNGYGPAYRHSLNAARPNERDLSGGNPLILQPNSTLVSVISQTLAELRAASEPKQNLKAAAVLTVLTGPAPEGSFRPPYCGRDKTVRFNKSQLDYSILADLAPVGPPSLNTVEDTFKRVWIDHAAPDWMVGYQHPAENMPGYGRNVANAIGDAALLLNLDFSQLPGNPSKETLFVRFVQLGIDLAGIFDDGGYWPPNGGIAHGRKLPVLMAGYALNDAHMKNVGNWDADVIVGSNPERLHHPFQEDSQTFYVEETSPGVYNNGYGGYTSADVGLPAWGIRHETRPSSDNSVWNASYRWINGRSMSAHALVVHIMGLKWAWNHDAFVDYIDRWFEIDYAENGRGADSDFAREMWLAYRDGNSDPPPPPDTLYGDVTGNGEISSYDASLTAQYAINLISLTPDEVQRADVTGNGEISSYDASLIAQYAIGLIEGF